MLAVDGCLEPDVKKKIDREEKIQKKGMVQYRERWREGKQKRGGGGEKRGKYSPRDAVCSTIDYALRINSSL